MHAPLRNRPKAPISNLWLSVNSTRARLTTGQLLARIPVLVAILVLIEVSF